jgi:hypothetical protein
MMWLQTPTVFWIGGGTISPSYLKYMRLMIPAELVKTGAVEQFALIYVNLLILFGIRRNCLMSGSIRTLYLFIRSVIRHFSNYRDMQLMSTAKQNSIQLPSIKINVICTGNY